MFDIGFWELLLIAVVALFVVGPEKLPSFVRKAGAWTTKIRRFIHHTRREIEQELLVHEQQTFKEKIADLDTLMKDAPDKILQQNEETQSVDKKTSHD